MTTSSMMHEQIEKEDIIERYARNQLPAEERRAFEEHFFTCTDCFQKLQDSERFIAGIRDAASRGLLARDAPPEAPAWPAARWWAPAFAVSAAVALLLAAVSGWLYLVQIPGMRVQISRSTAELRAEQKARASLEAQLRRQQALRAEANVPLVILQATRSSQAPPAEAILPSGAARLILWIDAVPARYQGYRLEIYGKADKRLEVVEHLTRNRYGALAASLPAGQLQPGEFRIKLFGEELHTTSLLAEYKLKIRRP